MGKRWVRRLPLLLICVVAYVIWSGAFGLLPTTRSVVWNLPVDYGAVRRVDLQIWQGGALLKREERACPGGLTAELRSEVPLRGGPHHALAITWTADGAQRTFSVDFDPGEASTTVIAPGAEARAGEGRYMRAP